MNRRLALALSTLTLMCLGGTLPVEAQTPTERGGYLVDTILACGNCHTPKDATGAPIMERDLSGGLYSQSRRLPGPLPTSHPTARPVSATGATTISSVRSTHGARPANARLPGVPLAAVMATSFYKAILPEDQTAVVAYLRSVKPVRNTVPDPVYRAPVPMTAIRRRMPATPRK